jgi:hypothetical protein
MQTIFDRLLPENRPESCNTLRVQQFIGICNYYGVDKEELKTFWQSNILRVRFDSSSASIKKIFSIIEDNYKRYSSQFGTLEKEESRGEILAKVSSHIEEQKKHYKLTPEMNINTSKSVLRMSDTDLLDEGDIGYLMAQPSTGKTQFMEVITAAYISQKNHIEGVNNWTLELKKTDNKILWIDTERTLGRMMVSLNNIKNRLDLWRDEDKEKFNSLWNNSVDFLSFKPFSVGESYNKLLEVLDGNQYDYVLIDGILHFAEALNDDRAAKKIVQDIDSLAGIFKTTIFVTIHPNKSNTGNAAGHLGSMLYRWSRCGLNMQMSENDPNVKEINIQGMTAKASYGKGFEPIYFWWDDNKKMMDTTEEPLKVLYDVKNIVKAFKLARQEAAVECPSKKPLLKAYAGVTGKSERTAHDHILAAIEKGHIKDLNPDSGKGVAKTYQLIYDREDVIKPIQTEVPF